MREKGLIPCETTEKHSSRAEARVDSRKLTARLKSCPFKTMHFHSRFILFRKTHFFPLSGSLSRSVTSASAARRAASSGVQHASGARQLQLPAGDGGRIHARLRAKLQQVLRRNHRHLRDACLHGADQRPHRASRQPAPRKPRRPRAPPCWPSATSPAWCRCRACRCRPRLRA